MDKRLSRLRGWRTRVQSLPNTRRSICLAWVWAGSGVMSLGGLLLPDPFDVVGAVGAFPFVWVSTDRDLLRLVTALLGSEYREGALAVWSFRITRLALILLAAFILLTLGGILLESCTPQ